MKRFQSILCASVMTVVLASTALAGNITTMSAGNITTKPGNITTMSAGNITTKPGNITTLFGNITTLAIESMITIVTML